MPFFEELALGSEGIVETSGARAALDVLDMSALSAGARACAEQMRGFSEVLGALSERGRALQGGSLPLEQRSLEAFRSSFFERDERFKRYALTDDGVLISMSWRPPGQSQARGGGSWIELYDELPSFLRPCCAGRDDRVVVDADGLRSLNGRAIL